MPLTRNALDAAAGYFSLGLYEEALEEIEVLPLAIRSSEGVMEMRLAIYHAAKHWEAGRLLAESLAKNQPANPSWWIQWAYCLRREKSVIEARGVLWHAAQIHPASGLIIYNLACYASVLGEMDEANQLLTRAFVLDPELKATALCDSDLEPIFGSDSDSSEGANV